MATLLQDLRFSLRQLRKHPAFAATAILTLGIGIGLNAVAFTVVNGVVFRNAVVNAGDDIGRVATTPGGDESGYASLVEFERFAEATRGVLDLAAEGRSSLAWRHDGRTETAWVLFVSPNYFSMLDVRAVVGHIRVEAGRQGVPSAVIGERFWRRKLQGAPAIGMTLRLNDIDVAIAGVLPESFTGPAGLYSPDVWLPLDDLRAFRTSPGLQKRDARWLFLLGRMAPGSSAEQVQALVDAVGAQMAHDWPDTHRGRGARFRLLNQGNGELRGIGRAAMIAMGLIGLVLLIACFNVTNLLLARAVEREREIGIRVALGARPGRLVRFVVIDGLVIAALAGADALLLARWTQVLVGSFAIPIEQPQYVDLSPDAVVLGFVAAIVLLAGVLPGLWPAVATSRVDVTRVLAAQGATTSGGRPSLMRRWLVGAQVAGSTMFLAIAALFAQSYGTLALADPGFDKDHLLVAEFDPGSHGVDSSRSAQFAGALLDRVKALPGVVDAAIAVRAPFFIGYDRLTRVAPAGSRCESETCPAYATMPIGAGYFRTLGVQLIAGREPTPGSLAEVVVNQPLARLHWSDGYALGQTMRDVEKGLTLTIVGITARTHTRGLDREQPTLYVPLAREDFDGAVSLIARTATPAAPVLLAVSDAARQVDPRVAMLSLKTMEQRMAVQLWPFRTVSWLFSICGVLALVLATVGLAGVVIHAVSRRRREFGVRISVGATPRDLVDDVLRGSATLMAPGMVAGFLFAAAGARFVQAAFVGVDVLNPWTYIAVALLECAVVTIACVGPALRASRTDPLAVLRE